ncbi:15178_t:CDS:2, partial [Acaulospora colombiana]
SIVAYIRLNSWYRFYTIDRKAAALGARTIPIVKGKWPGNLDLLIRLMQTPKEAYVGARLYEFFKQYKTNTINIRPLGMDLIMTCDHGIIKEMLATGFARWEKGPRQREKLADFFGRGIFAVDGEEWKMHRSMTRPYLSKERTSDFDTFWKYARKDVPVLDIQDLLARFTMDSASEFLFGKCLDTLKGRMPVAGQAKLGTRGSAHANATEDSFGDFATAFEKAQMVLSNRAVRAQKKQAGESESNDVEVDLTGEEPTTLLGELVTSINDPIVVRNELLNILLAGRDTTAALLTFVIYMLSQHPDVEEKLRDEINKTWIDQDEQPTYETVKKMKYLRAVLDETLRLFPPGQQFTLLYRIQSSHIDFNCSAPESSNELRGLHFTPD